MVINTVYANNKKKIATKCLAYTLLIVFFSGDHWHHITSWKPGIAFNIIIIIFFYFLFFGNQYPHTYIFIKLLKK